MLEVIRTILTSFKQGVYNIFTGQGRVNETIQAVSYQHYGFVSVPPTGTEFVTLQYGQNAISVAETYPTDNTEFPALSIADVLLYSIPTADIGTKKENYFLYISGENQRVNIRSATSQITLDDVKNQILIGIVDPTVASPCNMVFNYDGKGTIGLNNAALVVYNVPNSTPALPGYALPLANQNLVTALNAFMVTTSTATTAAQIAAAASTFISYLTTNLPSTEFVRGL